EVEDIHTVGGGGHTHCRRWRTHCRRWVSPPSSGICRLSSHWQAW
ncbi:hypothetical protein LEMLEM_LOCUS16885, partial [Lemmus lemmus]